MLPAFTWVSQQKLDAASYDFAQGNCVAAREAALSSISVLGNRSEPYEILGYCDVRLAMPGAAVAALDKAVSLDPGNWNYRYDLAVMQAADGLDPLPTARRALQMDPKEALVQQEWNLFTHERPQSMGAGGTEHRRQRQRPLIHMRADDFERLYETHAGALLNFLHYRTGDRALAEDLLADTFERVLRARRGFNRRRASEKTWLYTIALNILRDHLRRAEVSQRAMERVAAGSFRD